MSIRERCQAFLVLGALLLAGSAWGQEPVVDFNIPPQGLAQALDALSRQGQVEIISDGTALKNKQSQGLTGPYTLREAVEKLLAGSGLTHTFTAEKAVAIKKQEGVAVNDSADTKKARKDNDEPTVLEEMTVTARPTDDTSYNVFDATTATKTDTPIMETPVSIQVVPRALMDDQQVIQLKDALKNISGVQPGSTATLSGGNNVTIRGFDTQLNVYRNGLRLRNLPIETSHLEQVEVLKGPASVLYGRVEPGGLVNIVTKRPLLEPYYSVQQQIGSFDLYRTTVDATGPLNKDRSLLYRANLGYQNSNSFRDFIELERIFFAPSLIWRPSTRTEFNLNVEYRRDDPIFIDGGIPAIGNRPAPVPISRFLGERTDRDSQEDVLIEFGWSHHLNDTWTLRQRFLADLRESIIRDLFPANLLDDNRTLERFADKLDGSVDSYATNLDLIGQFDAMGMRHNVLVGIDYYRSDYEFTGFFGPSPFVPPIDIFNPVYGVADLSRITAKDFNFFLTGGYEEWYGIYFQDQITLWDKLHLLGGGRYDWATESGGFSSTSLAEANAATEETDEQFSPRVGLVYQPWSWLSLYGNYVESFGVNNGRPALGQAPFDPQMATQYEVGVKTDFFDGALTSTLAFYHLTKTNILTADLSTLDPTDRRAVGEQRSQGIELDVSGQVTETVSLIGSYAFTDTEVLDDPRQFDDGTGNIITTQGNAGHRFANVPRHAGSLFAKYAFQEAQLRGLSLGAGVFAVSQREGDLENSFQLPGYVRLDAFAAYEWKTGPSRITAQLNINNLLDKEYFESTPQFDIPRSGIVPGAPLTVLGSLRVEF